MSESWREALRLLVADCKDDDVDEVVLAILNPMSEETPDETARARVTLAALCLADEPNVSEGCAREVLNAFSAAVEERDGGDSSLSQSAGEVGTSIWAPLLKESLIGEFRGRSIKTRGCVLDLWGGAELAGWRASGMGSAEFFIELTDRLKSNDPTEATSAALTVVAAAFDGIADNVDGLVPGLLNLLELGDPPSAYSAALALSWLSGGLWRKTTKIQWLPNQNEVDRVARTLETTNSAEVETLRFLAKILENCDRAEALPPPHSPNRQFECGTQTIRRQGAGAVERHSSGSDIADEVG